MHTDQGTQMIGRMPTAGKQMLDHLEMAGMEVMCFVGKVLELCLVPSQALDIGCRRVEAPIGSVNIEH